MWRSIAAAAAVTLGFAAAGESASAQQYWVGRPVIGNYNYYVQPPHAGAAPAEMYPSPRPVPGNVGVTYYTYEPFAPHQFLQSHARVWSKNHGAGGRTTTFAIWF